MPTVYQRSTRVEENRFFSVMVGFMDFLEGWNRGGSEPIKRSEFVDWERASEIHSDTWKTFTKYESVIVIEAAQAIADAKGVAA